jgi:hypothetical protein
MALLTPRHLGTLPSGTGENLNQIFWDGQYIFVYAFYKDLKADLYRWAFDESRACAFLHYLYGLSRSLCF